MTRSNTLAILEFCGLPKSLFQLLKGILRPGEFPPPLHFQGIWWRNLFRICNYDGRLAGVVVYCLRVVGEFKRLRIFECKFLVGISGMVSILHVDECIFVIPELRFLMGLS